MMRNQRACVLGWTLGGPGRSFTPAGSSRRTYPLWSRRCSACRFRPRLNRFREKFEEEEGKAFAFTRDGILSLVVMAGHHQHDLSAYLPPARELDDIDIIANPEKKAVVLPTEGHTPATGEISLI